MKLLLAFLCLIGYVSGDNTEGRYRLYQIEPETQEQLDKLREFEQQGWIDFWRHPTPNSTADVMIDEQSEGGLQFIEFLKTFQVKSKVLVDDLARLIEEREIYERNKRKKTLIQLLSVGKWQRDASGNQNFGLQMGEYHSYDQMLTFMAKIESALPGRAQVRTIGQSAEGKPLQGIQFGRPSDRSRKVVWIDGGIHAREWTAVHTTIYFIYHIANELLSGRNSPLTKYLETIDVLLMPCLNPDGYEYTFSDPRNPLVRFWRKNRSKQRCEADRNENMRCCLGVDLNRNFDFHFAEIGTSYFACSEIFHGSGAFSEPESRAIRDAVLSSDLHGRIVAFVTMHAYSQLWIYPYSDKTNSYPADIEELKSVARRAVSAISEKFGTDYKYGTGPEIIYAYTGGSADWAKQTAGIKYTYTIELRPTYSSWNGFILEKSQLIPTARETFDGILVVLDTVYRQVPQTQPRQIIANNQPDTNSMAVIRTRPAEQMLSKCEDSSTFCRSWVRRNSRLCVESRGTMMKECRRTCSFC